MAITESAHASWESRAAGFQIRTTLEGVGHKAMPTKATCCHLLTRDAQGTGCSSEKVGPGVKWPKSESAPLLSYCELGQSSLSVGMIVQSSSTAVGNEQSHLYPELRCW